MNIEYEQAFNVLKSKLENASFEEKLNFAYEFKKSLGLNINVYENPTPVVAALIPFKDKEGRYHFVAVRRGISPNIGELCLPGGYVDKMESAQEAAAREVFEETGLSLKPYHFKVIDTKISNRNTLMIFAQYGRVLHEKEVPWEFKNDETQEVTKINRYTKLCFRTHQEVVNSFWR